ncbi:hypothetical protein J6590_060243 [Homalodisca vitripennis]|nr:hypothetical protein J6590_060243 [Homalodisca vitripennis]
MKIARRFFRKKAQKRSVHINNKAFSLSVMGGPRSLDPYSGPSYNLTWNTDPILRVTVFNTVSSIDIFIPRRVALDDFLITDTGISGQHKNGEYGHIKQKQDRHKMASFIAEEVTGDRGPGSTALPPEAAGGGFAAKIDLNKRSERVQLHKLIIGRHLACECRQGAVWWTPRDRAYYSAQAEFASLKINNNCSGQTEFAFLKSTITAQIKQNLFSQNQQYCSATNPNNKTHNNFLKINNYCSGQAEFVSLKFYNDRTAETNFSLKTNHYSVQAKFASLKINNNCSGQAEFVFLKINNDCTAKTNFSLKINHYSAQAEFASLKINNESSPEIKFVSLKINHYSPTNPKQQTPNKPQNNKTPTKQTPKHNESSAETKFVSLKIKNYYSTQTKLASVKTNIA